MLSISYTLCFFFHVAHGMVSQLKFHVAPMQAYTNQHLRYLFGTLNSSAWLWTEMEKTYDLLQSDTASRRRLSRLHPNESNNPCVLQLGGNNAAELRECVRLASKYQYDEINLNCGCPSVESGGADYGAILMKDPDLTRNLLESMKEESHDIPISIKIRLAAHDFFVEGREESYDNLLTFVNKAICSLSNTYKIHVVVHARAAILSGLSTVKNRSIPPLKQNYVHRLSRDLPHLRITLNGGISSLNELNQVIQNQETKIDGIMAGRWILRRPLDLFDINQFMQNKYDSLEDFCSHRSENYNDFLSHKRQSILKYGEYAAIQIEEGFYSKSDILAPLCLVAFQLQEDIGMSEENDDYMERASLDILQDALYEAITNAVGNQVDRKGDNKQNIRGIIKLCKRSLGAKVFNKIKRNRNEL